MQSLPVVKHFDVLRKHRDAHRIKNTGTRTGLITPDSGSAGNQSFAYDLNGNRTSHTWGGSARAYTNGTTNNRLLCNDPVTICTGVT
jgi:hypothetical protein